MSKLDQLKELAEARRKSRQSNPFEDAARGRDPAPKGFRIKAGVKSTKPIGDGVALTSIEHPPGLIEKMAEAISSGKLSLKRKRAPRGTFDRNAYQREYMRKRRQKEAEKK